MRFRILTLGLVALAVLVAAGVVGAASTTVLRGHSAASASAATRPRTRSTRSRRTRSSDTFTVIKNAKNLAPGDVLPDREARASRRRASCSAGRPASRSRASAFANVFDRSANTLYEAVVDLKTNSSSRGRSGRARSPPSTSSEYARRRRPGARVRAVEEGDARPRLDPKDVYVDVWAARTTHPSPRLRGRGSSGRSRSTAAALPNPYDRPIEGVVVTVDMNKLKVVDFVDSGIRPVNTTTSGSSHDPAHGPEAARRHAARRPELHARRPRRRRGRAGTSASTIARARASSSTGSATSRTASCGRSSTAWR